MPSIEVQQTATVPDGWAFAVRVSEDGSQTEHRVTLTRRDYERLTRQAVTLEALVEKTFEFLLARERKEGILREFELIVVTHYFPEFETELKRMLTGSSGDLPPAIGLRPPATPERRPAPPPSSATR